MNGVRLNVNPADIPPWARRPPTAGPAPDEHGWSFAAPTTDPWLDPDELPPSPEDLPF